MNRFVVLAVALAATVLWRNDYVTYLLLIIALYALPAIGLSLLWGYTGQISLGHAAFYGLGAYGAALLAMRLGCNPWLAIPAASASVGVIAWCLGWLVFRLKGHHLAMATLAFGIIVHVGLVELNGLTGGPNGLTGIPPLTVFGVDMRSDGRALPLAWAACIGVMVLAGNLVRSPLGLSMRAVCGNERVAASIGTNVNAIKRMILGLSGFTAALAGGIYAHYLGYLSPGPFDIGFSIRLLLMVAVGGFADLWGVLFGVAFVTVLGESLKPLGNYDVVVFGVLLVAVILFCPDGLSSALIAQWRRLVRRSAHATSSK